MCNEYVAFCHLYDFLSHLVELRSIVDHIVGYSCNLSDLWWDRSLWINECFVLVNYLLTIEYYNADLSYTIPIGYTSSSFYIDNGIIFQGAMML